MYTRQLIENKLDSDPLMRTAWAAYDARMRLRAGNDHADARVSRTALRERHERKASHTYPNFLRIQVREAVRLAFHAAGSGHEASSAAAREKLGWLMEEPHWYSHAPTNGWISDLWTADDLVAAVLTLEYLPDDGADRLEERRILYERGVEPLWREWVDPATRIHALDSMGHNWWSVCVAATGIGLLATADVAPAAEEKIETVIESLKAYFAYTGNALQNKRPTFGPDGAFLESAGYMDYALDHVAAFGHLLQDRTGRRLSDELPVLPRVCDYALAVLQPLREGMRRLSFGDMTDGPGSMGAYTHFPMAVWLWLAGACGRDDLFHLARTHQSLPREPAEFLYWPQDLRGDSFDAAPGDRIFDSIGLAALRDGYSDRATVLALKTGETWNHNQSDAGSFILSASGVPFLIDPGTTGYGSPLHASYFKTSSAHNVVLHGGRGQAEDLDLHGTRFPGRILHPFFHADYKYMVADATGPWEGVYRRFHRHVCWFGPWVLLVDDLLAWSTAEWESLFHFDGDWEAAEGGFILRNQGEELRAHIIGPGGSSLRVHTGHRSAPLPNEHKLEYDLRESPYLGVCFPGRSPSEQIMTAFRLPGAGEAAVEPYDHGPGFGARLTDRDGTWDVFCNRSAIGQAMHKNSWAEHEGLRTDGFLTLRHWHPDGTLDQVALHNGSFVGDAERLYFSSLAKGDVLWRCAQDALTLHTRLPQEGRVWLSAPNGGAPLSIVRPAGVSTCTPTQSLNEIIP